MGQEREFYIIPDWFPSSIKCHSCRRELKPGDRYYMTDDDSWLFCEWCSSGKEKPRGPRPAVYPAHEREPLHKKRTLKEQV
jgi:hypothetical protein